MTSGMRASGEARHKTATAALHTTSTGTAGIAQNLAVVVPGRDSLTARNNAVAASDVGNANLAQKIGVREIVAMSGRTPKITAISTSAPSPPNTIARPKRRADTRGSTGVTPVDRSEIKSSVFMRCLESLLPALSVRGECPL